MQIVANNLSVQFSTNDGGQLLAVGPITFTIDTGSFVTLLGPSGSGKSTIIRVVAGLQQPSVGSVSLDNQTISGPNSDVALMFQSANLMPWRSVYDNIALPLEVAGIGKAERNHRVHEVLPILGLQEFDQAFPSALSGGMAQRVSLGRVLVQKPEVLLLDEPFGALDAMTREKISLDLLRVWAMYKQTVLMVTHDINEAVLLSDRILVLSQRPGRLIADIQVPLDRPRHMEMVYTDAFIETARDVRHAIDNA